MSRDQIIEDNLLLLLEELWNAVDATHMEYAGKADFRYAEQCKKAAIEYVAKIIKQEREIARAQPELPIQ